jgi:hypothetical protein
MEIVNKKNIYEMNAISQRKILTTANIQTISNPTTITSIKMISPARAEKIARNINAMDLNYQYSDDLRGYKFWSGLEKKLKEILKTLSKEDKEQIKTLCNEEEARYFGL